jgi:hemolysin activation/secretion protein
MKCFASALTVLFCLTTLGIAQPISRIDLGGTAVPAAQQLERKLSPFLGQTPSEETVGKIADTIVAHYQHHGQPVVVVSADSELKADGALLVTIEEGKIAAATISGGQHLNTTAWQKVAASMAGKPMDGIATQALLDRIQLNPFAANTTLSAAPGDAVTDVNLQFKVPNISAWQATLGYSNDGVKPLGANRWRLGGSWGNAFNTGTRVSADIAMGEDTASYLAESLSWSIPLPWEHELSLSAAHASTSARLLDEGAAVDVGGDAWLASLRYTVPWRSSLQWKQSAYFGVDYKHFDTDLTFGGLGNFSQPIETSTLVLGVSSSYQKGASSAGAMLEAAWSPGHIFAHDTDADYAAIMAGASSEFRILRSGLWSRWELPHAWTLQGRISGQWADGPLLPSEEASIAGMAAVRGYEERSILGKQAIWGAAEFLSPPIALPSSNPKNLRLISFFDAGNVWSSNSTQPNQAAIALGCGVHASWKYFQLKCEVAWPLRALHHDPHHEGNDVPRLHVSANITF